MLFGEEFASGTTGVDVVGDDGVPFVVLWPKPMDQECIVRLAGWARLAVDVDGASHLPVVGHLQDEETTGSERTTTAADDIAEFRFGLTVVNRPGERADNVVGVSVGNLLHPLNPEALVGKTFCRTVDHALGRIETAPVNAGRTGRFEKHTGPAADIEKLAVVGCDAERFGDDKRVVVVVVAGWRVQVVAMRELVEELIHGFNSRQRCGRGSRWHCGKRLDGPLRGGGRVGAGGA